MAGHDRLERESRDFHERVRAGYHELARRWPERYRVIRADAQPDEVEQRIWEVVAYALPHKA